MKECHAVEIFLLADSAKTDRFIIPIVDDFGDN